MPTSAPAPQTTPRIAGERCPRRSRSVGDRPARASAFCRGARLRRRDGEGGGRSGAGIGRRDDRGPWGRLSISGSPAGVRGRTVRARIAVQRAPPRRGERRILNVLTRKGRGSGRPRAAPASWLRARAAAILPAAASPVGGVPMSVAGTLPGDGGIGSHSSPPGTPPVRRPGARPGGTAPGDLGSGFENRRARGRRRPHRGAGSLLRRAGAIDLPTLRCARRVARGQSLPSTRRGR